MDIFLVGEGKPVLLKEDDTRKLEEEIVERRRHLPFLLRELMKIPGQGRCLSIVGGFTRCGVHGEYCQIDFDRAIGWGLVVGGMPRFRGVIFSDWTAAPTSAKAFIEMVKAKMGL